MTVPFLITRSKPIGTLLGRVPKVLSPAGSREPAKRASTRPADGRPFGEHLGHACERAVDVLLAGQPVADRDPHDPPAVPGRTAEPGDALGLDAGDDLVGGAIVVAVW